MYDTAPFYLVSGFVGMNFDSFSSGINLVIDFAED